MFADAKKEKENKRKKWNQYMGKEFMLYRSECVRFAFANVGIQTTY